MHFSLCHPIVKFGSKRSSDSTKKPGASAASARDVSAAERSKCVYIFILVATQWYISSFIFIHCHQWNLEQKEVVILPRCRGLVLHLPVTCQLPNEVSIYIFWYFVATWKDVSHLFVYGILIISSVKFGKSSESAASMPGAKSANDSDVSNAERG